MTEYHTTDLSAWNISSHWRWKQPADRRLLFVYAHPDDESFGNAGTIIRYAAAGVAVHYACATRGEVGVVDPALLSGYAHAGELRTAEQLCAAEALDLAAVHFLNHRDSGMPGTEENRHPDALVQQPAERIAGQIVALIRSLRPQVIVTFNPYGGYGHPDHIACHHAALMALEAAPNPERYPEQIAAGLSPWRSERLYYSTFQTVMLRVMITMMRLRRRDPRRFGSNQDIDLVRAMNETTPVTTRVASAGYLARKEQAWSCHHSQGGGPRMKWLPATIRQRLSAAEEFTRIYPAWSGGQIERGLFGE
jgi:LmbE family N-acetylglucosaminyl deacetylase